MDSWGLNYLQGNMTNSQGGGWDQGSNLNYLHPDLDLSLSLSIYSNSQEVQTQMHGGSPSQTTNVNEVTIIPQRTLSQAGENSEGNHSFGGLEVLAEATVILTENKAATSMCTNCKRKMLVDSDSNKKAKNVSEIEESSKSVPAPAESTFNCPICLSPFVEPTATRCGHIFCKECILDSLKSSHNKCPNCRKKIGKRSIFRVFLPTTN